MFVVAFFAGVCDLSLFLCNPGVGSLPLVRPRERGAPSAESVFV